MSCIICESSTEYYFPKSYDKPFYSEMINSALFEHIFSIEELDDVNKLVEPDVALMIHTVVCENILKDADWFYLERPVNTTFHTNKSISIFMEQ